MGMPIDEQIDGLRKAAVICTSVFAYDCQGYIKEAIDTLCKYQQLQADYENRLKADLVAMLTEIQLEIEEQTKDPALDDYDCGFNTSVYVSGDIIQQKINTLKEQNKDPFTQAVSDLLVAFSKQIIENHEKEQNNE